jgi:DNA-binding response OmpR family regulator
MSDKILVVDDDRIICEILNTYLTQENFIVTIANDGQSALECLQQEPFDLILLDIILPDTDGNQLTQTIRQINQIPIILISARGSDVDKAISLGLGGDDYITKPFTRIELVARVKAHLRRFHQMQASPKADHSDVKWGPIRLDLNQRQVWVNGKEVILTTREFNLLQTFVNNSGHVLTKEQLFSLVWGDEFYEDNTIMVAIRRLRAKIEEDPASPKLIQTVRSIGYRLNLIMPNKEEK